MFRSFEISTARISLSFGSITTHQSHISSEPAFIAVSSTIEFNDFLILGIFLWFVLLNPVPDRNMTYFN